MTSTVAHCDEIEKLTPPFYIRWTSGPNYEKAYLCVEDGEPDMREFATVSFGEATLFKAAMSVLAKHHISGGVRKILEDFKVGIHKSIWHDVYGEQMKRVFVAESMIDRIDSALEAHPVVIKSSGDATPSSEEHSDAVAFLQKVEDKDWSLDWLVANVIAQERNTNRQ